MLSLGDLAELVSAGAKAFRNSAKGRALVARLTGSPINTETASQLAEGVIEAVVRRARGNGPEAERILKGTLATWAPDALEDLRHNSHQHEGGDRDTVDEGTADALIIRFANTACAPGLDLGMFASDLR